MADFVNNNGIDGIDIEWEYPSASDIPGIPPGSPKDAANYLAFLKLLRTKLATGKSMCIAAPASFWYLKAFPIAEMSKVLDYIVLMTYDLHGQWDHESTWVSPGCPKGSPRGAKTVTPLRGMIPVAYGQRIMPSSARDSGSWKRPYPSRGQSKRPTVTSTGR